MCTFIVALYQYFPAPKKACPQAWIVETVWSYLEHFPKRHQLVKSDTSVHTLHSWQKEPITYGTHFMQFFHLHFIFSYFPCSRRMILHD